MAVGGHDPELLTERRVKIDGGLNTRSGAFDLGADQCVELQDLRLDKSGSLIARLDDLTLCQTTWPDVAATICNLTTPVLTGLPAYAGATLQGTTYTIGYWLTGVYAANPQSSSPSPTAALAVSAGSAIQIDIPAQNLGDGVGQGTAGGALWDDPFNGGPTGPFVGAAAGVLAMKAGDPNMTRQNLTWVPTVDGSTGMGSRRAILTGYAIGSTVANNAGKFPIRHLAWNPSAQILIGFIVDRAGYFNYDLSTFTYFSIGLDKTGLPHFFSRCPTPIKTVMMDGFMIACDGIGKPKVFNYSGGFLGFTQAGANPPAAAPTAAAEAGSMGAGDYLYVYSFVYQRTRPDGTTTLEESNPSEVLTAHSAGGNVQWRLSLSGTLDNETGILYKRIYVKRPANGAIYFLAQVSAATTSYLDDGSVTVDSTRVPYGYDQLPANDTPNAGLYFPTVWQRRVWYVQMRNLPDYTYSTTIRGIIGTNKVYFTKPFVAGSGNSDAVDAVPVGQVVQCGDDTEITGQVVYRNQIYVFKSNSIGLITGSTDDTYEYREIYTGKGAMKNSVIVADELIYFWDEAVGACIFDGMYVGDIGHDIHPTWEAMRDATGIGVAGKLFPLYVWHDKQNHEIVWNMSTLTTAPPVNYDDAAQVFKEVRCYTHTKKFYLARAGLSDGGFIAQSRAYQATASAQLTKVITGVAVQPNGLYHTVMGRMDGKLVHVEAGTTFAGTAYPLAATFKMFVGDSPEWVCRYLWLHICATIPNGKNLKVYLGLQSSPALVLIATLTNTIVTADMLWYRVDVPDGVFSNICNGSGYQLMDRGLILRIICDDADAAGIQIHAAVLKFKKIDDHSRFPIGGSR